MKTLLILGLCVALALAAPRPDDDDNDDVQDRQQQQQNRRRMQQQQQQQQIDDDDEDQRQQQFRRRLQELTLKLMDNRDDDRRQRVDQTDRRGIRRDRDDNQDDDLLRQADENSNLDVLASQLDTLSSKYKGRGVLKVSYSPPMIRNTPGARIHNLGNLNFKYITPSSSNNRMPITSQVKSRLIDMDKLNNNGYVLLRELDQSDLRDRLQQGFRDHDRDRLEFRDRSDLRDRDDDDDDDQ